MVYRNGFCLETLCTISSYGHLNLINIRFNRLLYWLKRGIKIDDTFLDIQLKRFRI